MTQATTELAKRDEQSARSWNPFDVFQDLDAILARLWGAGPHPFRRQSTDTTSGSGLWIPTMNLSEGDQEMTVTMDLPGVRKEDLDVSVFQGDLVIRGERAVEDMAKDEKDGWSERSVDRFYRSIALPPGVTAAQIEATFKDGVLQLCIPAEPVPSVQKQKVTVK